MPADPTDRYTIKVLLYNIEPVISRRFSIRATATFKDFHRALQDAMGWQDKHLHEFRHGKGKRLTSVIAADISARRLARLPVMPEGQLELAPPARRVQRGAP